jgi:tetratricopeptide (TPR) repeat protein
MLFSRNHIVRQDLAIAIMTGALLGGCAWLTTSQSAAEPILGEESLNLPSETTTQKQEAADALAKFEDRDYDGSLKLWREAVKKNVDMPPAQVIMAELYFKAGMPKEAQNAVEQAIIDAPGDPEPCILMASIAMRNRNLVVAESLYEKAKGLLATFTQSEKRKKWMQPTVYSGLAAVAESRKDWAGAQKVFEALLKLEPKNTAAMLRVAFYLFQQKNVDGALEKLREAAKAAPAMATPEVLLAQFYEAAGDHKNAEKWMAAALTTGSKNLKTRLAVGQWALDANQLDEAQKHAIAATKIDPKSLDAKLFRGVTALYQKDYAAAESIFESAVKQAPQNVVATNNLALALIAQQDESKSKRALEYADANAKQMPKSPEVASTYGLVLYRLGRLDDAEKALRIAAPLVSSDVDTAYTVAIVLAARNRKAEARQVLETALKQNKPCMFRQEAEELLEELKK